MPMCLKPDRMSLDEQQSVAAWMHRNGCRHYIALEPITIHGQWAEYTAICRDDDKSLRRMPVRDGSAVMLGKRRVRIRYPIREHYKNEEK